LTVENSQDLKSQISTSRLNNLKRQNLSSRLTPAHHHIHASYRHPCQLFIQPLYLCLCPFTSRNPRYLHRAFRSSPVLRLVFLSFSSSFRLGRDFPSNQLASSTTSSQSQKGFPFVSILPPPTTRQSTISSTLSTRRSLGERYRRSNNSALGCKIHFL